MNLKDQFFNEKTLNDFLDELSVYHEFDQLGFLNKALNRFPLLELKERISCIRELLKEYMPEGYLETIDIFTKLLKNIKEDKFIYASILEYVEFYGCKVEFIDFSLDKLGEFTSSFTAEFVIRRFINQFEDKSLLKLYKWSTSSDFHQRRLASEGSRPKLPWAVNINLDYRETIPILDNLYYDSVRYVTRSVANHLNDISKIDSNLVIETLKRWKLEQKQNTKEMQYIVNHSLRTLVKKGDMETLSFLGFTDSPKVIIDLNLSNDKYNVGDYLEFEVEINPLENSKVVVDYIVHYPTNAGNISKKTFKIKSLELFKNTKVIIKRKNKLENRTTRKLCSGIHKVFIQLNGLIVAEKEFILEE